MYTPIDEVEDMTIFFLEPKGRQYAIQQGTFSTGVNGLLPISGFLNRGAL
jgi:hypothetical protein